MPAWGVAVAESPQGSFARALLRRTGRCSARVQVWAGPYSGCRTKLQCRFVCSNGPQQVARAAAL